MRAGQKFTCSCGRNNVVAVERTLKGGAKQVVASDHYKPDNKTWCNRSGRVV